MIDNKELRRFYKKMINFNLKKFKKENSIMDSDENKIKINSFRNSYVNETSDMSLSNISFFLNNKAKLQNFSEFLISLVQ